MSNRFSNSTPAAQRARNLANAAATNSKPPVQKGSIPSAAGQNGSPMVLPPVRETQAKPAIGPGLPSRIK
jgi:hypothetical protein